MPVRSMTLTTRTAAFDWDSSVSDACQINDFDHSAPSNASSTSVSDACQINDFDHVGEDLPHAA